MARTCSLCSSAVASLLVRLVLPVVVQASGMFVQAIEHFQPAFFS
jgi:hypothetical protein